MATELEEKILSELAEIKAVVIKMNSQLQVSDIRLSLIEQRLKNIEQWIPVDNKSLHFTPELATA